KGDRLATASEDQLARVFAVGPNADRPAPLFAPVAHRPPSYPASPPAFVDGDRGLITIVQGKGQGELGWWDTTTGQPARPGRVKTVTWWLSRVQASPDGHRFAVVGSPRVEVWDVSSGKTQHRFDHLNGMLDLAFSPDGTALLTASWDHRA